MRIFKPIGFLEDYQGKFFLVTKEAIKLVEVPEKIYRRWKEVIEPTGLYWANHSSGSHFTKSGKKSLRKNEVNMNQIRELTKEDWGLFEKGVDLILRCQLGQLDVAFMEFFAEFSDRVEKKENPFGPELTEEGKRILKKHLKEVLENAKEAIAWSAFGYENASSFN